MTIVEIASGNPDELSLLVKTLNATAAAATAEVTPAATQLPSPQIGCHSWNGRGRNRWREGRERDGHAGDPASKCVGTRRPAPPSDASRAEGERL